MPLESVSSMYLPDDMGWGSTEKKRGDKPALEIAVRVDARETGSE